MPSTYIRQGKSWSAEEDRKLYDLTVSGCALSEICDAHQRSEGGIRSRQVRLGLREERNSALISPAPPFEPYRHSGNPRKRAQKPKSTAKPTAKSTTRAKLSSKVEKPSGMSRQPTFDKQACRALIENHPNLIDRIWAGLESDIKDVFARRNPDNADRDAYFAMSRLSPGNEYFEVVFLQDLGDAYGITRERVRQIVVKCERLLKARIRSGKSMAHGVLRDYRLSQEGVSASEFYKHFIQILIDAEVTNAFADFILTALGRMDSLPSGEIDRIEAAFRQTRTRQRKEARAAKRAAAKAEARRVQSDKIVSSVLAKASFRGTFAAEGVRILEMPRLRSCSGERELFSETLGRFVQWESNGERQFIEALDQSSIITEFAEQPIEIEFPHEGRVRKYLIDLIVKTVDDLSIAVEIKSPVMLADTYVQAKAGAAERILGEQGIGYCLVDPNGRSREDIRKVTPGEELKVFLRNMLREKKKVTMRDLVDHLGRWPSRQVSDQIQSLVLEHGLGYRVKLLPDRHTGKLGTNYTFTLTLPSR